MRVRFVGTAPMTYKGTQYFLGQELDVSPEFFALHKSRLEEIDDVIEGEVITNVEPVEIQNVAPTEEKTEPKRRGRKKKAN